MAEKPRLKKSSEILGSIVIEPSRAPNKTGAVSSRSDESGGHSNQSRRGKTSPEPKTPDIILDEEEIELNDQAVLPSAQSLAEKLFSRNEKHRQITPEKFEVSANAPLRPPTVTIPITPTVTPSASEPAGVMEYSFQPFEGTDNRLSGFQMQTGGERQSPPREQRRRRPSARGLSRNYNSDNFDFEPAPQQPAQQAEPQRQPAPQQPAPQQPAQQAEPQRQPAPQQPAQQQAEPQRQPAPQQPAQQQAEPQRQPAQQQPVLQQPAQQQAEPQRQPAPQQPVLQQPAAQPRMPAVVKPATIPEPKPYNPPEFDPEPEVQAAPPPKPKPRHEPKPEPISETAEDIAERDRKEFLNRLSSQFELQFEEKFEEGTLKPREIMRHAADPVPKQPAPSREPPPSRPRPAAPPPFLREEDPNPLQIRSPKPPNKQPPEEEDFLSYVQRQERERQNRGQVAAVSRPKPDVHEPDSEPASDFIAKFGQEIKDEEERRSEEFKETLAEKFMRERERYLKELDIMEEPEPQKPAEQPAQPSQAARRKLDFQIQPEMHLRDGDAALSHSRPPSPRPASGPVTYSRGGAARPLQPVPDDEITGFAEAPPSGAPHGAKKSAEQLLMEHGRLAKPVQVPKSQSANLKFTFATPEEQSHKIQKKEKAPLLPTEKWPRRIVLISMISGLFAIGLLIWPIIRYTQLSGQLSQAEISNPAPQTTDVETLNVYNDLSYSGETARANNVIFKNAGITLKNVAVSDYVIIEGISGSGRIRLEDVSVDNAVSVKACGVSALELHNVNASRVIINNPDAEMTISATGSTNIDVMELRTPAAVSQSELTGDASGIQVMTVSAAESGGSINTKFSGLALRTLTASAENSVISFENNTSAESMSSDGSLSLSGSGRVMSLSIGSKIGQGAGDTEDRKDVTLLVKGVTVSNLNVKSPANLNLSTTVDNVSTSDPILIGGDGSVGVLTLNPKPGSLGRLLVDIAGLNIQSIYSNVQSRINITGSARVNILTAGESTYALGNKVNSLVVNANDVIYENEPDSIATAVGIKPPQSKAENPNLDYNLSSAKPVLDTVDENFSTTCGHSRESGGFLIGDGSKDNPFEVTIPAQLSHITSHLSSHFKQTDDIDVSSDSSFTGGFPIIGSASEPFTGIFDGMGFAISRLRIISTDENVGLFASNKGIIQNVRIVSGEVSSSATNLSFVGGLVGLNSDGGMIRSCSNGATVTGNENTYTGGIVGYNFGGKVHDCYNYAIISGVDAVGGIVGCNRRSATLAGSYNVGDIEGREDVGGVAGVNEDATITNCYFLSDSAEFGIGAGQGTATDKTSRELQEPQMAADLAAGNENSLWIAGETSTNGYHYPMLKKPTE